MRTRYLVALALTYFPAFVRDEAAALPWLANMAEAQAQAQKRQQPILLYLHTETCAYCRKLEADFPRPEVQKELARWVLLSLEPTPLVRNLPGGEVQFFPTLRLVTPTGRLVAEQVGYKEPARLLEWLEKHHAAAANREVAELTGSDEPAAVVLQRLVGELKKRDPIPREAAVRRLLPFPRTAAAPVAEAFAAGPLQARLASLELLREWGAPVADLDPWRPETLTPARLESLKKWSANPGEGKAKTVPLTPEHLTTIRQELVRLVQAADVEAAAIRERLARFGPPLLPEVYAHLKKATTDQERERLTALRYRLAASDALALGWPSGLERLAATAAATRQQAVQELANRATPADEALLLELFSNPDPLVRELSLRALHGIAGRQAATALTRLLQDPDPNVRAAVLKQLAEKPTAALVPKLQDYIAKETDTDLVVHAVRVLRGLKDRSGLEPLMQLTDHASWRVRAEAVEGLGEFLKESGSVDLQVRTDIFAVLIDKLQDEDGFVVGRAVQVVGRSELTVLFDPLLAAAERHPDLAGEVLRSLPRGKRTTAKTAILLRKFCSNERPDVRATAITELCRIVPDSVAAEVGAALKDKDSGVRIAAANALFTLPALQGDMQMAPAEGGLLESVGRFFAGGPSRPPWITEATEPLRAMLKAESAGERLAAARPLVVLGHVEEALPAVTAAAKGEPALREATAAVLRWLPWKQRLELFNLLLGQETGPESLALIVREFAAKTDPQAIDVLWDLAGKDRAKEEAFTSVWLALRTLYFGPQDNMRHLRGDRGEEAPKNPEAVAAIRKRAESGPDGQRLMALAVLALNARAEAAPLAAAIVADPKTSAALRREAFQVMIVGQSSAESDKLAVAHVGDLDPVVRRLAIQVLAQGVLKALNDYGDERIRSVIHDPRVMEVTHYAGGEHFGPIVPKAPAGLQAAKVRPLLKDSDPATVASAAYLLTLLGEPAGLEVLLAQWHKKPDDATWQRLVYRAIAASNDDARVPVLEEIYQSIAANYYYDLKEFYWTVRVMNGPQALALRKQMRQDFGQELFR